MSEPAPAVEMWVDGDALVVAGEPFTIATKIGALPMMRFAKAARDGMDTNDMEAMAMVYELLEQAIDPPEWAAFQDHLTRERCDTEDLLAIVALAIEVVTNRPSREPSDSSSGHPTVSVSSAGGSSSPVEPLPLVQSLQEQGRPSLAVMVMQAQGQALPVSA